MTSESLIVAVVMAGGIGVWELSRRGLRSWRERRAKQGELLEKLFPVLERIAGSLGKIEELSQAPGLLTGIERAALRIVEATEAHRESVAAFQRALLPGAGDGLGAMGQGDQDDRASRVERTTDAEASLAYNVLSYTRTGMSKEEALARALQDQETDIAMNGVPGIE